MNKSYEIDMCHGPLLKQIIIFSVPLMLSGILQLLFNAADIIVVGRFTGSDALAAVGSTSSLINLLVNLFIGISVGANVLFGRFCGAHDDKNASETVHTAICTAIYGGIIMIFVGNILARPLLELMGTPQNVIDLSTIYILNYTVTFFADLLFSVAAFWIFDVPLANAVLLFFFTFIAETAFEAGLIVFLYSGEERFRKWITAVRIGIFLILAAVAATAGWYLVREGLNISSALHFLESPVLQMIPVAGWNMAAVRFIVLGRDMWNTIGMVLYIVLCVVMLFAAYRIKCSGEYYEDAAKFADDYKKLKEKSKKGESSIPWGKKRYRLSKASYKGTGAKAIFYRQLSEYKKERFFIFGGFTLTALIGAVVCIVFVDPAAEFSSQLPPGVVLMGIIAYVTFIGTGFLGKWGKELELPYIYLIPAPAVKKLWYATLIDHIKSLIDVSIFAIPVAIAWKIPMYQVLTIIITYVLLQANRLYVKVLGESIFGRTLGETAKQFFRMGVQGGVIGIGIVLAVVAGFLNFNLLFLIVPVYSMIITVLIAALSVPRFETMEQWE